MLRIHCAIKKQVSITPSMEKPTQSRQERLTLSESPHGDSLNHHMGILLPVNSIVYLENGTVVLKNGFLKVGIGF